MPTLRFGDKGEDVKVLQRILMEQGYFAGKTAGNFLKFTQAAVIYFQETHLGPDGEFLEADGIVGDKTWWALNNPSGEAQKSNLPRHIPVDLSPIRTEQLTIVLKEHELGVREDPDGSNWGDGVIKYKGFKGAPWCCYFWSWCNKQCFGAYSLKAKYGHCLSAWRKAESLGFARNKGNYIPIPGDAFVMLYKKDGKLTGKGHIGFVYRVEVAANRAVTINTVEGNSSNRVKIGKRNLASPSIVGFINSFPADEQPTDWERGLVEATSVAGDSTR
ncbi:MAG: CHAP domain-containing protein [Caldithrix sp.]|nr:MAG: CHAP domain-containing protein [Caldithrix sp.]TDI88930.1 MAG: CHAP domain-containing protein [Caldithrix sp.]